MRKSVKGIYDSNQLFLLPFVSDFPAFFAHDECRAESVVPGRWLTRRFLHRLRFAIGPFRRYNEHRISLPVQVPR